SDNIFKYIVTNVESKKFKEYALEVHDYKLIVDMIDKKIIYAITVILIIVLLLTIISRFVKDKKEEVHILAQTTLKESLFDLNENYQVILDMNLNFIDEIPNITDLKFTQKMNALI
ncbi:hypothetical protein, partial [Clostridium perfringens]|uniref:hypothetical protein n=1 Tax=Clostridium perfringens TaxID=1502 RepID=UPI0032DAD458